MAEPTIDVLCKNCGQTFTAFLTEMADKNAEVTCPSCADNVDGRPSNQMPPLAQH
jgi:DNA-directed RNA polymerase subunit RPC12/RpoP